MWGWWSRTACGRDGDENEPTASHAIITSPMLMFCLLYYSQPGANACRPGEEHTNCLLRDAHCCNFLSPWDRGVQSSIFPLPRPQLTRRSSQIPLLNFTSRPGFPSLSISFKHTHTPSMQEAGELNKLQLQKIKTANSLPTDHL